MVLWNPQNCRLGFEAVPLSVRRGQQLVIYPFCFNWRLASGVGISGNTSSLWILYCFCVCMLLVAEDERALACPLV